MVQPSVESENKVRKLNQDRHNKSGKEFELAGCNNENKKSDGNGIEKSKNQSFIPLSGRMKLVNNTLVHSAVSCR